MLRGRISEAEYEERIADLKGELDFIHKIDTAGYLDDESLERVCRLAEKQHVKENGEVTKYLTEEEVSCLRIRKGTLTVKERKEMENHVVVTGKILEKVRFNKNFEIVPKWASSHHEFLNGSGYPKHLKAEDLELETRILTVADIYEALAANRPYKDSMPKEKAFLILRDMVKDGKVDGKIVDWLFEALKEEQP